MNMDFKKIDRRRAYIRGRLKQLIELGRSTFYTEKYRAGIEDAEILGVMVAGFFEWTGQPIIKAFQSALEDANFHTLNSQITDLVNGKTPAL